MNRNFVGKGDGLGGLIISPKSKSLIKSLPTMLVDGVSYPFVFYTDKKHPTVEETAVA